jgi:hypothetical protein
MCAVKLEKSVVLWDQLGLVGEVIIWLSKGDTFVNFLYHFRKVVAAVGTVVVKAVRGKP